MRKLLLTGTILLMLLTLCNTAHQLTAEEHGSRIQLGVGETVQVTLDSSPFTGYRWEVFDLNKAVLVQKGEVEMREKGLVIPGSCCEEIFTFEAVGSGETEIVLGYHQPWEDVEPIELFIVTVIVE